ncbi:MAG TPA: hypothetical protein VGM06_10640 [Polyangiaceae bacterium]|jgi:hypothetical protein
MRRSWTSKVVLFACALSPAPFAMGCTGGTGAADHAGATGAVSLALTTSTNGVRYRLENVEVAVFGQSGSSFLRETDPDEAVLSTTLPTGAYTALMESFALEKDDGTGTFLPVGATLEQNELPFTVENGATTTIVFRFQTDGVVVVIGSGQVNVVTGVDTVAPVCTPFGSDCGGGTWCPPAGLTGAPLACVPAGPVALGQPCLGPADCVAGASCFDLGGGARCTALCPPSNFGGACATGGSCLPEGADFGVCDQGGAAALVSISAATQTPRTSTWSVNYWQWPTDFGDEVAGTESLTSAIAPALMRVGGYNNDVNSPDPFDDAQLDAAVAYARAVGAEPILQVPLLADTSGQVPTAAFAASMVAYANVTKGYGIKYFSIGNEPDLYPDQGSLADPSLPAIPGYTPASYCASATAFVAAMKQADPTIHIVGPDLAYKYQSFADWLTPILQGCGSLFDIVSIHRYPFNHTQATLPAAMGDVQTFATTMTSVRGLMTAAGYGGVPLALTEMNIVYDATPPGSGLAASPGTVPAALWVADAFGESAALGLWTTAIWDISDVDPWDLGLIGAAPEHTPRPAYYALDLFSGHSGPTLLPSVSSPAGVRVYASRNAAGDGTQAIVVNWNATPENLLVQVTDLPGGGGAPTPSATITVQGLTVSAVDVPDVGVPAAWTYGQAQLAAGAGPVSISTDGDAGASP